VVSERRFTAEEVDDAVAALSADPERFSHAQEIVGHAAPGLQRVLNEALHAGGFFADVEESQLAGAVGAQDEGERLAAVRTLVAEETRLGMLVGVAIGLELGRELYSDDPDHQETT
jgi:hypothetical protein